MKNIFICLLAVLMLSGCQFSATKKSEQKNPVQNLGNYELVWADEFEYSGLPDSTKWGYDTEGNEAGWGNQEAQHYTEANEKNAFVENGILHIVARKEKFEDKKFTSARLLSKADWKYGRIEVKAKLPTGRGTWSAIWMMPGGWSYNDGNWPNIGEIDIAEHVGYEIGVVHSTIHCKDYNGLKHNQKTAVISVPDVAANFHTYLLEWSPDGLKSFVDDSLYFEYQNEGLGESSWPYNKPYHLILNIAVGGAWGGMKGIDKNAFPQTMEVDYVRIYQKSP